MIYIRPEGGYVRNGLNLYSWKDRKYNIGFIFRVYKWQWYFRYSPVIKHLYCSFERAYEPE